MEFVIQNTCVALTTNNFSFFFLNSNIKLMFRIISMSLCFFEIIGKLFFSNGHKARKVLTYWIYEFFQLFHLSILNFNEPLHNNNLLSFVKATLKFSSFSLSIVNRSNWQLIATKFHMWEVEWLLRFFHYFQVFYVNSFWGPFD
jgi:hypothetical protein